MSLRKEPATAPVITVDGPSGTGKGTVSQILAKQLGWKFLDSGALYRVLALAAERHGISYNDENDLEILAKHLDVQFLAQASDPSQIILEGEDVTDIIRTESIGNNASIIAALPAVRAALLDRQRAFRDYPGLVADGRDMGTVVFPQAKLKIFLKASIDERAKRRLKQLKEKGINVSLSTLVDDLRMRDRRDQERAVAPLKPATDAVIIETDNLTVEEVVKCIVDKIKK